MGILPYNYGQYGPNSIYDSGYELRRQLETRQAQLDALNKREVLSDEQLSRKNDLEKTVSLLRNKLDKQLGKETNPNQTSATSSSQALVKAYGAPTSANTKVANNVKNYNEGRVIAKSPTSNNIYSKPSSSASDDSFLKGFFFDARI